MDFKYQWLYSFDGFSSPVCIIGLRERERERNQFYSLYITELRESSVNDEMTQAGRTLHEEESYGNWRISRAI